MTAEVGVMNRMGIALAADSAVTIGRAADKIYTSADKLFHLSSSAPVGIMINGNANFLGVPWETTIKTFRSKLGSTRYDSLEEYGERFLRFVERNRTIFPLDIQDRHAEALAFTLLSDVRDEIGKRLDNEAEDRDGLDEADYPSIVADVIRQVLKNLRTRDRLQGFGPKVVADLRKRLLPKVNRIKKHLFGNLKLTPAASRGLISLVFEMLSRHFFGPFQSGVVVAGFGERDFMPRLLSYNLEEMVLNRTRRIQAEHQIISDDNTAAIVPFAQQEMVHSFLRGIDPNMSEFMRNSTGDLFTGVVDKILDVVTKSDQQLGANLSSAIKPEVQKLLVSLFGEWNEKSREYWGPVVQIASSLPKEELAAMAEALVNLTKFRRRISAERETVGGPIDVAVITKGDGFVWVKRKHYFDASLNPRVIARYGREGL